MIVDNRPGANGIVAAKLVAKALTVRHTIFHSSSGLLAFSKHFYPQQQLDLCSAIIPQRLKVLASSVVTAMVIQPVAATAEDYPDRPVRIVIGFAPGGGTDVAARFLAQCKTN